MLALKEAAHRSGNHDYKPYFDVLFKDVEETEKQTAMKLLNEKFQFNIKDLKPKNLKPKNLKPKNLKPKEKKAKCLLIRTKTDGTGGTRKYTKNLCHKKSVKKPNKCKKMKGCKVAKGTKRSYCRKAKELYKK